MFVRLQAHAQKDTHPSFSTHCMHSEQLSHLVHVVRCLCDLHSLSAPCLYIPSDIAHSACGPVVVVTRMSHQCHFARQATLLHHRESYANVINRVAVYARQRGTLTSQYTLTSSSSSSSARFSDNHIYPVHHVIRLLGNRLNTGDYCGVKEIRPRTYAMKS